MAKILMGLETEYGITPFDHDGNPLERQYYADLLVTSARERYAALAGCNPSDLYLANGSRLYVDAGLGLINLEYSTPECTSPQAILAQVRAGDRILAELARELQARRPELRELFISKTSFDYCGHTSGSHENYLHESPQAALAPHLIAHLVTRMVYSGGGGFDERSPNIRFMLSPRVCFLEEVTSDGAQSHRGIFTTRMEPLSRSRYGRLHLLCGEGVRYGMSEYLRFGTTALIISLIDAGLTPAEAIDINPLQAVEAVASDTRCQLKVGRIDGLPASAIEIQRHYLDQVQAQADRSFMPAWTALFCAHWRSILDRLESQPMDLAGVLDWPSKLSLYRAFVDAWRLEQDQSTLSNSQPACELREKLFECDIRFGDIADDSLFARFEARHPCAESMIDDAAIAAALRTPPQDSRARLRGHWVQRLSRRAAGIRCNWDKIVDTGSYRCLHFDDPTCWQPVSWEPGRH